MAERAAGESPDTFGTSLIFLYHGVASLSTICGVSHIHIALYHPERKEQ